MAEPNESELDHDKPSSGELSLDESDVSGTHALAGDACPFARLAVRVALIEATAVECGNLDLLDDLEPDQLLRLLRHVAVAKRALDAIEARALNVVERRGSTVTRRGHRTRRWWANETGMSHAQASRRVRVATRIHEHYPKIGAALEAGHLSFDCAAALIRRESERTREGFVELQDHLVRLAVLEPFERFEQAIEAIALRLDPDGPKPDDPRLNRLRITNEFGNTRISALFDPVNAEVVLNAIRRAVDAERWASGMKGGHDTAAGRPIGKESLAEGPPPKKPDLTSSAAAATDTILRSGAVGPPVPPGCGAVGRSGTERGHGNDRLNGFDAESIPSESDENLDVDQVAPEQNQPNHPLTAEDVHRFGALPEEPGDSIARLQGQAFLRICERALTAWDRPGRPPTAHIDLIMHEDDAGFAATRTTDGLVDGDRLAELMCNAVYRLVKVDRAGTPLEIGRAQRLATADQRRAVFLRDGGCVFPGCAAPVTATDLHHVERWRDGGATDLDNLACLCRFHHSVTHSTGWHMSGHAPTSELPHRFEWRTPAGDMLRSVHHPATTQRQKTG